LNAIKIIEIRGPSPRCLYPSPRCLVHQQHTHRIPSAHNLSITAPGAKRKKPIPVRRCNLFEMVYVYPSSMCLHVFIFIYICIEKRKWMVKGLKKGIVCVFFRVQPRFHNRPSRGNITSRTRRTGTGKRCRRGPRGTCHSRSAAAKCTPSQHRDTASSVLCLVTVVLYSGPKRFSRPRPARVRLAPLS